MINLRLSLKPRRSVFRFRLWKTHGAPLSTHAIRPRLVNITNASGPKARLFFFIFPHGKAPEEETFSINWNSLDLRGVPPASDFNKCVLTENRCLMKPSSVRLSRSPSPSSFPIPDTHSIGRLIALVPPPPPQRFASHTAVTVINQTPHADAVQKHRWPIFKGLQFQTSRRVRSMPGTAVLRQTPFSFSFQEAQNIERDRANVNRNPSSSSLSFFSSWMASGRVKKSREKRHGVGPEGDYFSNEQRCASFSFPVQHL